MHSALQQKVLCAVKFLKFQLLPQIASRNEAEFQQHRSHLQMALLACTGADCASAATPQQIPREDVRKRGHTERSRKPPLLLTSESKAARARTETCLCLNSTLYSAEPSRVCWHFEMIARTSVVNYILCFCLAVSVHIHMSPKWSLLFKCLGSGPGEVPR